MKILTNFQFAKVAGIAQSLSSFLNFVQQDVKDKTKIVGVGINPRGKSKENYTQKSQEGKFTFISEFIDLPNLKTAIDSSTNLEDFKKSFEQVTSSYKKALLDEKPDVVLINGTYYMPWCLLLACQGLNVPVALHYHGSISKETSHYPEKPRNIMREMEKNFDSQNIFYIFPSTLTKDTVEKDVFGHEVKSYSVLPNAIPLHFFNVKAKASKKKVGLVSRWTRIKNIEFFKRLAFYNERRGGKFSLHAVTDLRRGSEDKQKLTGIVNFHRPVENEYMARFYQEMGTIISPSSFETYGNVAQEALASGTPALVGSNMGVSETFRALGLEHWIVDFNSLPTVYKKMEEASGEIVSDEVRAMMKERYCPSVVHGQMLNLLKNV